MARPAKASVIQTGKISKNERKVRTEEEKKLRGRDNAICPPEYLTEAQANIFRYIVKSLRETGILGNLDVYILAQTSVAIDREQSMESQINGDPSLLCDRDFMGSKDKYDKLFLRCCSELSLSPQSRAKIAGMTVPKEEKNPLLEALNGE